MILFDKLRATDVSPKTAAIAIGALMLLSLTAIFTVKHLAEKTPGQRVESSTIQEISSDEPPQITFGEEESEDATADNVTSHTDFTVITTRNLFKTDAEKAGPTPTEEMPTPQSDQLSTAESNTPPSGPLPGGNAPTPVPPKRPEAANIAFTGIVDLPNGRFALLENLSLKDAVYVQQGGSAYGFRIMEISPQAVVLEQDGHTVTIRLGENKKETEGGAPSNDSPSPPPQPPPPGGESGPPPPHAGGPPPGMPPIGAVHEHNVRRR